MANSNAAVVTKIPGKSTDTLRKELAQRVVLGSLQTGAWRAAVKNEKESMLVNKRNHTDNEAKVIVKQCDHKALHEIYSLNAAAYNHHKKITLPSVQDGIRVIIAGKEIEHSDAMKEFADKVSVKIDELAAAGCYRGGAEYFKQKKKLNGLFDEHAWPFDEGDLRARFLLRTHYLPCPTDGAWADWFDESITVAKREVEEQVEKAIAHVSARCLGNQGNGTGRLHESVFRNLDDLLDMLATFDVDKRYDKVISKVKSDVTKYSAEELRKDVKARADVAKRAEALTDLFSGLRS